MQVKFYNINEIPDTLLKFAVIIARSNGKWVMCKHRERDTYEVPGGHREAGENIFETARRELKEETGAISFDIEPVCVYSVTGKTRVNASGEESFGLLCCAQISEFSGELHSEMEKVVLMEELPENWTYPLIQPKLIAEWKRRGYDKTESIAFKEYDEMTREEMYSLVHNVYMESCIGNAKEYCSEKGAFTDEEFESTLKNEIENFVNFFQKFFATADNKYYVLEENGIPLCAARLSKIDNFYYLEALETAPEHRKKGYATRLLNDIINLYSLKGAVDIRDCVNKKNTASLATHKKCGFTIAQENGTCYLYNTTSDSQYGMRYFSDSRLSKE